MLQWSRSAFRLQSVDVATTTAGWSFNTCIFFSFLFCFWTLTRWSFICVFTPGVRQQRPLPLIKKQNRSPKERTFRSAQEAALWFGFFSLFFFFFLCSRVATLNAVQVLPPPNWDKKKMQMWGPQVLQHSEHLVKTDKNGNGAQWYINTVYVHI